MQVSCFGMDLKSGVPSRSIILHNTDLTVDSRECEFECSPSREWRESRLLTIQITAAAEWLWQLTVWQQRTQGFSAGKNVGRPGHTHGHTSTHMVTHTWITLTNWYIHTHTHTRSHTQTHAHTPWAKCSHPRLSCFTAQTQQGPWQTCAHSANWAAGLIRY